MVYIGIGLMLLGFVGFCYLIYKAFKGEGDLF